MVQVLQANERKPSLGQRLSEGLGRGLEIGSNLMQQRQQSQMMSQAGQELLGMDISGFDPDTQKALLVEGLKQKGKGTRQIESQSYLDKLFGGKNQRQPIAEQEIVESAQENPFQQGFQASELTDEDIARATSIDPNLGRALGHAKDVALREGRENKNLERREFSEERKYHTDFSKKANEEVEKIRSSIPRKEMALNYSRDALERGDLGFFTLDKLADITGSDLFRTARGAQLITASKENLLSNMGRVSAKGQNVWFEQRLNQMFPKIGQSEEANKTVQEMIEGEVALDKAYTDAFDRLSKEDEEKYGFQKKDISKRAHDAIKPLEKEIFKRSTYRMKEIEEQAKGLSSLKKSVGKNVTKGTPLTLAMAKLYHDKFGENALDVAKKNGYYIPTKEEFLIFQKQPQQYREEIAP